MAAAAAVGGPWPHHEGNDQGPLPACQYIAGEPCRRNSVPVPPGQLTIPRRRYSWCPEPCDTRARSCSQLPTVTR